MTTFINKFIELLYEEDGGRYDKSSIYCIISRYIKVRYLEHENEELYEQYFIPYEVALDYLSPESAMHFSNYPPIATYSNC